MNLNKKEQNILIRLLEEEMELNPYDKEKRELLKKLKKESSLGTNTSKENMEKKSNKPISENSSDDNVAFGMELIRIFYKAGVVPSPDGVGVTDEDIKIATEYFLLCLKLEETTKKFYKTIKEKTFDTYEEFEEMMIDYNRNIVSIVKKQNKIVEDQQKEFRRRVVI